VALLLQVHAANDAVFEDIAAGFSELCSSLLPSLQLQLARTGQLAHEGLQFRCAAELRGLHAMYVHSMQRAG
jgi:hypothetical protein